MSAHRQSVRSPQEGFSFIELLVTIVIAGIAFAALVPLFVTAHERDSGDNARNIALQVAQDKIEKVRQLDYEQVTAANFADATYAGGQFGSSWDFARNGVTKSYSIRYTVSPVPAGAAEGMEKYKKVEVHVSWTAPPAPVKPAVLQTLVYRQYAGPSIESYSVGPTSVFDSSSPDGATITSGPVVVVVNISLEDIASMDAAAANVADRGWVKFSVISFTGVTVASQEVSTPTSPGRYEFTWDNSAAQDGIYKIEMTAVSASEMQGSTAAMSYNVELLTPPAPTGLTAVGANGLISLSWDQSLIGDFSHYQLWRGTSSGGAAMLVDGLTATSYSDTAVTNGTTYYYQLLVVDQDGNLSPLCAEVSATPGAQSDTVAPGVPTGLTAAKMNGAPTVSLSWTASTDGGTPVSGVRGYVIERSATGTLPWAQLQGAYPHLAYPDSGAGWASTWYYRIAAIDNAGNVSAFSAAVGPVTTDPQPLYSLSVSNTSISYSIYLWVQNVGTGQWYSIAGAAQTTKPAGVQLRKNKSNIWSNLPAGIYNVYASRSTGGTPLLASTGGSDDLSAGNNTISF